MVENSKLITFAAGLVLIAIIILTGLYVWLQPRESNSDRINVLIEGVPPITVYNHTGDNAYITTDLAASLVSVLTYYGEDLSIEQIKRINNRFFDNENQGALHQLEDIKFLAEELGYNAVIEVPGSVADFRKYFDSKRLTPVIFSHFMEIGQHAEVQFKPMGVLIGMLDDEQSVVVHDYYFGYNKKLSYREFGQLGAYPAQVLVITPKIPKRTRMTSGNEYIRSAAMDRAEPIINDITLARVAYSQKLYEIAAVLYDKSLTHPDFEVFVPPYYKVVALSGGAHSYIRIFKDYDSALKLAQQGVALNKNLDDAFSDFWPGFVDGTNTVMDEYGGIHYALGKIYEHKGRYEDAIAQYTRAIEIYPFGPAKSGLERLRAR